MKAYYNEFNKNSAQWLRNLISDGELPNGEVDERSIVEVKASDLKGFNQYHFFAGIGGWPLALRLSGWPEYLPVITGSCPCQPYSLAGKQRCYADERDLWPDFFRIISELHPPTVFGEQVDNKHGKEWLTRLRTNMEGAGYAVGDASLNSASIGANQIRQRLYWVADSTRPWRCWWPEMENRSGKEPRRPSPHILSESRPDGRGSISNLSVCDVCSPSHGVSGRVGALRGYGNAIDPEVAKEFIVAYMEARL